MTEVIHNLVSTIIPVYNRPQLLREAVASVLAQTYRPIEIIFSDDGSTDETPDVIRELMEKHPDIIRAVFNKKGGAGPAREAGRRLARGEFIQYLDSDDLLLPRKFEVQVKALHENPECGAAYGITRLIDQDGQVLVEPFKWTGKKMSYLFPGLLVDRWWCTHTPLYRRRVTDAAGAWTDLRYSQDWEYDARIGALGIKLVWCSDLVSEHRTHSKKRQTGHGKWLDPQERVRFFSLLLRHALYAGVPLNAPEMKHFVRWVFSHARQCGEMGDSDTAKQLFELTIRASGGESLGLRAYRTLANLFGWSFAGKLAQFVVRSLNRRTGTQTLKQSWMK
jgi:glycosyltransferase involved in cell wall biosynthesis